MLDETNIKCCFSVMIIRVFNSHFLLNNNLFPSQQRVHVCGQVLHGSNDAPLVHLAGVYVGKTLNIVGNKILADQLIGPPITGVWEEFVGFLPRLVQTHLNINQHFLCVQTDRYVFLNFC